MVFAVQAKKHLLSIARVIQHIEMLLLFYGSMKFRLENKSRCGNVEMLSSGLFQLQNVQHDFGTSSFESETVGIVRSTCG